MGVYRGGKYDQLLSRTYTLGSVTNQAYTTGSNLFTNNLTAPADGIMIVKAKSSADKNIAYLLLNSVSGILFPDVSGGAMLLNTFYTTNEIPVENAETINFTFSKSATINLTVSFTGVIP